MANLRIDLAYHGAAFHGFARQRDVRTVQGDLEEALTKLFHGVPAETVGAGRTDAGVHACGQVVSVPAPGDVDVDKVRVALNGMLAPSIAISSVSRVTDDFNARFSARSRTYVYAILRRETPDPFLAGTTWHQPGPLDVEQLREAAGYLVGDNDFSSFGRAPDGAREGWARRQLYELSVDESGGILRIRARANAFIQQMVRSLVGTLVAVGTGRMTAGDMPAVLAARDRAAAGPVAPPHGLCLVSVEYDEGWSRPA